MINKKIILITIMLIGLFAISAVSAVENVTEETEIFDEILSIENDEKILEENEGTFNDLNNIINGDDSVSEINLVRNYTFSQDTDKDYTKGINLTRSLIINGNGHAIDGNGQASIFYVNCNNVILKNITFKNGYYGGRGGAVCWDADNGQVINCTFTKNYATLDGGAIFWYGDNGTITNTKFTNNTSKGFYSCGGAIYWHNPNGIVTNSTFTNNNADYGGAIYWYGVNGLATECTFNNNTTTEAGALYAGNAANCIFKNNNATRGGAIMWGNAANCIFKNNNATRGGAIMCGNDTNCSFINNSADEGGALYVGTAANCSFINNKADYSGAVVLSVVVNCLFSNNKADYGGAIIQTNATNCLFINNSAEAGGAVLNGFNPYSVLGCYFVNNTGPNTISYWEVNGGSIINNIFLNNNGTEIFLNNTLKVNTDYNWFGNNASNYNTAPSGNLNTWLFLNATINPDNLILSTITDITFKLYLYNSISGEISEYDNTLLKNINLTVTQTKGKVDKNSTELGKSIQYIPTELGAGTVTATVENANFALELISIKIDPDLSIDTKDVLYPENTTLTLNYNQTATGKVNITLKGKKYNLTFEGIILNNTIALGNINSDEYNVTLTYSGDSKFINATSTTSLKVNRGQFEIGATITGAAEGDFKTDQNATVTIINIPSDATGEIVINISEIDKNYTFTLPVTANTVQLDIISTPGTYTLIAQYTGDDNYNASNIVTKTFTVSKWNETNLQALIDNSTDNVTLEHDYEFINENATVNVTDSIAINGNGHTIDANGSSTALNITSDNVEVNNMTLTNVNGTAIASNGTNTTISNVEITNVNGTAIQLDADNSTVTNITATNTTGTLMNVTGDNNTISNINATGNATINVDGKGNIIQNVTGTTVIPSISATNAVKGNDVIITATVSAAEGNVTVQFQGKKYTVPITDGKAVIKISNVGSGTYENVTVNYEGTLPYQNVSTNTSFTSKAAITGNKDVAIDYLSGYKYTIRVMNADGTYFAGTAVTFTVNGVKYTKKTDSNGYAKLLIELKPKTYTITTQFLNVKKSNKITVKSTISSVKKTVKVKKTAKKLVLKAKLKWFSGKAIKGKVVKFKFKGKTYKAKTNSKGIAKVTIKKKVIKKLKKGKKYKFIAKYVNEYVKGKVKVKK